ncbi:CapA family protein [soil metagenome]
MSQIMIDTSAYSVSRQPWLRIALTGDVLPARALADAGTAQLHAAEPLFELLRNSDLAIGNFEMPLTARGAPLEKLLNIRADASLAQDLPAMGFDLLNVANNHTVDYGWDGLSDTIEAIGSVGVKTVGAGIDLRAASAPSCFEVNGVRVGVLAWSALLPTGMAATMSRPGLAPLHVDTGYEVDAYYQMEEPGDPSAVRIRTRVRDADRDNAVASIKALRAEVDVLVATVHWGFGSGEELAEYQQPLAEALIDAGADIVHGHHPHAVHAIGFHRGKPILYSLGTFIGQQIFLPAGDKVQALWAGMSADGYVATVDFDAEGDLSVHVTPTTLNTDRLPEVAVGTDFERIVARLQRLSRPHGAQVIANGQDVLVRPLASPSRSRIEPATNQLPAF